jgi:glycosyltransferase involved in cell wall biosynthesis
VFPSLSTRLARAKALSPDLLYIDNICLWPVVDMVCSRSSVFRIMDPHEEFPGWKGHAHALAARAARSTSGTLFSHPQLESYARSLGAPRIQFHPNAVDLKLFAGDHPRHPMFDKWSGQVAVYVGAVDYRLDFELTARVAGQLPDWDFVLAGPVTSKPKGRLPANVHFPGPIPRSELPSFLKSATAGFLPYNVESLRDRLQSVRPLKLLECLAAGRPVVCAHWEEVEKMGSPALLYRDDQECVAALESCAENPVPSELCRRFAAKRDWSAAFEELLDFAGLPPSS